MLTIFNRVSQMSTDLTNSSKQKQKQLAALRLACAERCRSSTRAPPVRRARFLTTGPNRAPGTRAAYEPGQTPSSAGQQPYRLATQPARAASTRAAVRSNTRSGQQQNETAARRGEIPYRPQWQLPQLDPVRLGRPIACMGKPLAFSYRRPGTQLRPAIEQGQMHSQHLEVAHKCRDFDTWNVEISTPRVAGIAKRAAQSPRRCALHLVADADCRCLDA